MWIYLIPPNIRLLLILLLLLSILLSFHRELLILEIGNMFLFFFFYIRLFHIVLHLIRHLLSLILILMNYWMLLFKYELHWYNVVILLLANVLKSIGPYPFFTWAYLSVYCSIAVETAYCLCFVIDNWSISFIYVINCIK